MDDCIAKAQSDRLKYGIPRKVYDAYRAHYNNCKRRNLELRFTLLEWWQVDNRWERRGIGAGKLVMARYGDVGPYSPGNVYCATHTENLQSMDHEKRGAKFRVTAARKKAGGHVHHLSVRGDGHPCSRAVLTPSGRFGSAALAADAHGITRQAAAHRARTGYAGWSFERSAVDS